MRYWLSRLYNLLKAEISFALSHLGIVRIFHAPTFVSIEPAAICQLRCPECPVGNPTLRHTSLHKESLLLSMERFETILKEIQSTAHTIQFYFQGEPLLNPQLPEMIQRARQAGLWTTISTNAQALTPTLAQQLVDSGIHRIIVSIDGFSQASYEAYRVGGSLTKALDGLRFLQEAKRKSHRHCTIVLQVLRLQSNEHEWAWIKSHYRALGADRLEMKTAQLYDYENGHPLMPTDPRYSRYVRSSDGKYRLRYRTAGACRRLWMGCVITTDGQVLPCCYDKSAQYAYGNMKDGSIRAHFSSKKAQHFRYRVLSHDSTISICQNCAC